MDVDAIPCEVEQKSEMSGASKINKRQKNSPCTWGKASVARLGGF